jgi:hypothetical protein
MFETPFPEKAPGVEGEVAVPSLLARSFADCSSTF